MITSYKHSILLCKASVRRKESFIALGLGYFSSYSNNSTGVGVIKLFFPLTLTLKENKLECSSLATLFSSIKHLWVRQGTCLWLGAHESCSTCSCSCSQILTSAVRAYKPSYRWAPSFNLTKRLSLSLAVDTIKLECLSLEILFSLV